MNFEANQVLYAREHKVSKLCLSRPVENFNIRPPKLLIFNSIKIFFKVLKKTSKAKEPEKKLSNNLEKSMLIDGHCAKYLIIDSSVKDGHDFLLKCSSTLDSKQPILTLFEKMLRGDQELA